MAKKPKNISAETQISSDAIEIRRTVDGKPASDTSKMLEMSRAELRQMEKRSRVRLRSDRYLWGIYLMLLIFSVVELYSASSSEVSGNNVYHPLIQHATYLFLGFCVVCVMQNIHYKYYRKFAWTFAIIAIGLVYYGNHFGVVANGAMRAIRVAGFTIQPPEIAKLAMVVILARVMAKNQMRHGITTKGVVISMLILLCYGALLYTNGLTNTALIVVIATAMFIIGGTQLRKLLVLFAIGTVIAGGIYINKFTDNDNETEGTATEFAEVKDIRDIDRTDLRKGRITSFLEGVQPTDSLTDYNRQVLFAKMSQAHGGIINYPGNARESARLPLAFSDYIFSIVVEDTGFVGGVALLIIYLLLLARAGVIASKCTKAFPALLITGCATLIVSQAMIHMCIVVGLAPVSGQPLPFISKGGTSILVMSAALGMMLSVSKYAIQVTKKTKDAQIALKQAVEDASDTSINPTSFHNVSTQDNLTYTEPPQRKSRSSSKKYEDRGN